MTDMIEQVARAICCARAQCDNCGCRSGHDCFDLALWDIEAQAAIAAHTAALIAGAGDLCERLLEQVPPETPISVCKLLDEAAATIAAMRAELAKAQRALRSIAWPMNEAGPWAQAVAASALPKNTVADSDGDDGA